MRQSREQINPVKRSTPFIKGSPGNKTIHRRIKSAFVLSRMDNKTDVKSPESVLL